MPRRIVAAIAVVILIGAQPSLARDVKMGAAGPFWAMGGGSCPRPGMAMFAGECDPPPVDASLPAEMQSRALTQQALTLFALLRARQAQDELGRAIALDPQNVTARHLRARALLMLDGDLALAEADMRAALAISPEDPDFHTTLAAILLRKSAIEAATSEIDAALARKPDSPDALVVKAELEVLAHKLADAAVAFDMAARLAPEFERAALRAAEVHMWLDEPDKAEAVLSNLSPRSHGSTAYVLRAKARMQLGKTQGAIDDFAEALGPPGGPYLMGPGTPDFTDLILKRAMLLHGQGRGDEAVSDLATALRYGGAPAALRMQLFLRRHGFPEAPLDGKSSEKLYHLLAACFSNDACGRSIVRGI